MDSRHLNQESLRKGIEGMVRAFEMRGINEVHFPVALLSGFFLIRNNDFHNLTSHAITKQLDLLVGAKGELFEPISQRSPIDSNASEKIANTLSNVITEYRAEGGHHVIYAAMVLKVCREYPELFTKYVVQRLCKLIEAANAGPSHRFTTEECQEYFEGFVEPTSVDALLRNVLYKLTRDTFHGHVLTHGQALLELHQLGYTDIVREGLKGHKVHLLCTQEWMKHQKDLTRWTRPQPSNNSPTTAEYWEEESAGLNHWRGGHHFKMCYSFFEIKRQFPMHSLIRDAEKAVLWHL